MSDFAEVLKAHGATYPDMQPQDAVKLVYQSEFGGGHLVTDAQACTEYLLQEWAEVSLNEREQLIEPIGDGMVRVHLAALQQAGIAPQLLAKVFIACANRPRGTQRHFREKLEQLCSLAEENAFSFTRAELQEYLAGYAAQGYPAVSHSEAYRKAYRPAYRVMSAEYAALLPLLCKVEMLRKQKPHVFIAIDGMAASGKTTLARRMVEIYGEDCGVIHMDDFFLPFSMRTRERYEEPGGNIHYERFRRQIIDAMDRDAFSYERLDCAQGAYGPTIRQPNRPVMVIEGSYSMHPYFGKPYDLTVFLSLSPQEQTERILQRNGAEWYRDFEEKWIPMEQAYHLAFRICEQCDFQWTNEVT